MYGTVARYRVKPGMADRLAELEAEFDAVRPAGMIAAYTFRLDADPAVHLEAVVFESEAAYRALADSPEQDARYRRMLALVEGPPEWHDGAVVFAHLGEGS